MRVAIYHRIANKNETSQCEIQKTIEFLSYICNKKNFDIIMIEYDYGSGLSYNREGLSRIKNAVINNQIDAIVLKDISRIGRDIRSNLEFMNFVQRYNVDLYFYEKINIS